MGLLKLLEGKKTYIGIGIYAIGWLLSGYDLGTSDAVKNLGMILGAGGFVAKINRAIKNLGSVNKN